MYYRHYQKYLRDYYLIRLIFLWIQKYQSFNVVSEKMSSENCMLFMVEKWKKCLDNKGSTGILLTDLSKAFDCLIHDLLLAKLHAYGFHQNAIKLIHSYLDGRSERVRIILPIALGQKFYLVWHRAQS